MKTGPKPQPLREFMESRIKRDLESGCWIWTGRAFSLKTADGRLGEYGVLYIGGRPNRKQVYAHRVAYALAKGPIPKGLVIDHLCRRDRCVNPAHLEVVTIAENLRRGRVARGVEKGK